MLRLRLKGSERHHCRKLSKRPWRLRHRSRSSNQVREVPVLRSLRKKVPLRPLFRGKPRRSQMLKKQKKHGSESLRISSKHLLAYSQTWLRNTQSSTR